MTSSSSFIKQTLIAKGVTIPDPDSVFLSAEVDPARIHSGTTIHPGCRISGADTSIGPNCVIGAESPATLRNCQLGKGVVIGGGFLDGTTMLDGASAGDGFHSRPGTVMEEFSSVAHTNGLKQTILMPYVTLGSLINFCDVLMAGGTGLHNHSEVGSSYIHFNFTPHQDKATASLIGDVPHGVMLDKAPIFLGGQGGLVGPCRIAFGTVVAAGSVLRRSVLEENLLITGASDSSGTRARPYNPTRYGKVDGVVENCLIYLGNLLALKAWYAYVRAPVMEKTPWGTACLKGAQKCLAEVWKERLKRLDQLSDKLKISIDSVGDKASSLVFVAQHKFVAEWPQMKEQFLMLDSMLLKPEGRAATAVATVAAQDDYLAAVKQLEAADKVALTAWLEGIVTLGSRACH